MTALVTCGHTRAGLASVRALGRAGIAVAVAAPMRPALALWSRYATTTLLLPNAASEARRFASSVAEEATARGAIVALASTDSALWALSRWRSSLPDGCQRVLPPHAAVVFSLDRSALHARARTLGVPCAVTYRIERSLDVEPVLRAVQRDGALPALVRPLVPWVEREDGTRRLAAAVPAFDVGALRSLLYAREDLVDGGCVVEPRPEGIWLGYGAVCQGGNVVAELFQQRLREHGDLSGVSTLARTIPADPDLRGLGRRVLRALSWDGPALVEVFRGRDGVARLVNVVPRLWGSLQLCIQAGVNVPLLCFRLARGQELVPGAVARPGEIWRWGAGDTEVIAQRARSLLARAEGPAVVHRRLRKLVGLLDIRDAWRATSDIWDKDDPLPFVLELQHRAEDRSVLSGR